LIEIVCYIDYLQPNVKVDVQEINDKYQVIGGGGTILKIGGRIMGKANPGFSSLNNINALK
jgi:hypothetical protein